MSEIKLEIDSAERTKDLAEFIARLVAKGDVIALSGEIGTGKTTFVQSLIRKIKPDENEITSPTFTLVKTYDTKIGTIWHFDLYRLKNGSEVLELGIDDALETGISIIEWPEIAKNYLPTNSLSIRIEYADDPNKRVFYINNPNGKWQKINEFR